MVTSTRAHTAATKQKNSIVQLNGIRMRYKNGNEALRGVDLTVEEGQIFGIIGPDGAGKTTAMQIIAGILKPSSGDIKVLNQKPGSSRVQIGYLPQNMAVFPELSVEENLLYEAGLRGVSREDFGKRRDELLKKMGLLQFKDRLAGKLSGGMKQKLQLGCSLIAQPKLLLLDEPTTGVDPISRQELWRILLSTVSEGLTLLLATPSLEEAEVCDQVALMFDGEIHDTGAPQELAENLGLTRAEVLYKNVHLAADAAERIEKAKDEVIKDVLAFGDRVQVLFTSGKQAEESVRLLIENDQIKPQWLQITRPNLEHVLTMKLREMDYDESMPPPLPRIKDKHDEDAGRTQSKRPADDAQDKSTLGAECDDPDNCVAIKAEKLSKEFPGGFQAVKGIDLEVKYGEIFGLLGANGAGKTTTIKMLCGILEPSDGQVTMVGRKSKLRDRDVRRQLGYMSQKFTLYDELSVLENLQFYASIFDIPKKYHKEKIEWALQVCGLQNKENAIVKSLPRGWKQRIAFGASAMHEPKILFLDEPTAGVDPIARRQLWFMVRDIAKNGTAVLVSTHLLEEASNCDRLVFMTDGHFVAQGTPNEIKEQQKGQLFEFEVDDLESGFAILGNHLEGWQYSIYAGTLHIILENPDSELPPIEQELKQAGVKIISKHTVPFRLEDAFISVIQRSRGKDNGKDSSSSK